MMKTKRLTMAQALVLYLSRQYVSRDGVENPFFKKERVFYATMEI